MTDDTGHASVLHHAVQRAVALALVDGQWEGRTSDTIPQDVWDRLHDEGLIVNLAGFPGGEPEPHLTPEGETALLEILRGA